MSSLRWNKCQVAIFIALLFHVCGFIGLLSSKREWFIANTPLNLLIMFGLIVWTQPQKNWAFFAFLAISFATGMITEIIGVQTSLLFGSYQYGKVLGPGIFDVPWLIGVNWFTVMYCCGVVVNSFHDFIDATYAEVGISLPPKIRLLSFIFDGAFLATLFDYALEPVAVKLGYWQWLGDANIPFTNYLCWFIISSALLTVFKLLSFHKHNQFAIHLLIIEILFFAAIRTFL